LRYTEIGELNGPDRVTHLLQTVIAHGDKFSGGHLRIISEQAGEIAEGRLQSWEEKQAAEDALRKESEAERARQHWIEEQRRAPVYEWCARCRAEREVCKNPEHRGNRCMHCCGGVGDTENRHCTNCLDLPYREKREKALGASIVYAGESESDD
jgi:hypothetical protein